MSAIPQAYPSRSLLYPHPSMGVGEDAKRLEKLWAEFRRPFLDSFSLANAQQPALEELCALMEECCQADWDGYGAQPVSFEAYQNAIQFLEALPRGVPTPQVSAEPDGEVSFEWYAAPNLVYSVSVGPNNEVTYAGLFGASRTYGTELLDYEIPDSVLRCIKRVTR